MTQFYTEHLLQETQVVVVSIGVIQRKHRVLRRLQLIEHEESLVLRCNDLLLGRKLLDCAEIALALHEEAPALGEKALISQHF